jgi:selenocysteine-specific elongation factor
VLDAQPGKHGPSRRLLSRLEALARGETPAADPVPAGSAAPVAARPPGADTPPAGPELRASALALEERLRAARFEPPLESELDGDDLAALRRAGRAVRISKTLHYHPEALSEVDRRVRALAARSGGRITLSQLRDELGTSRKFAQALLEHLDSERVTIRRGEHHVLRGWRSAHDLGAGR